MKTMKEWVDELRAVRDDIKGTFDELAHRIDALEARVKFLPFICGKCGAHLQFNGAECFCGKPHGVYVREGMRVTEKEEGSRFTVKAHWGRCSGWIYVWTDDGEVVCIHKDEITYNGKPVLGYEEDRP